MYPPLKKSWIFRYKKNYKTLLIYHTLFPIERVSFQIAQTPQTITKTQTTSTSKTTKRKPLIKTKPEQNPHTNLTTFAQNIDGLTRDDAVKSEPKCARKNRVNETPF